MNGAMEVFTLTVVIMIMLSATSVVSVRHFKRRGMADRKSRLALFLMSLCVLSVAADVLAGGRVSQRLSCDMMFSISSMLVLSSSLWKEDDAIKATWCLVIVQTLFIFHHVMVAIGVITPLPVRWYIRMTGIGAVFISALFLTSVHLKIREVRLVISMGNVWSCLCILVDSVYVLFPLLYAVVLSMSVTFDPLLVSFVSPAVSLGLALEFGALGVRLSDDSAFVIRTNHERRIVESMKISHLEVSPDSSKVDDLYRNIYERVVQLFETDRLYLDSELTINDIVKVVYTNKVYISRAISQFTGRNFCQFVNYYRVIHSIRLFRENPDLKVAELANLSGFNSSVTYAMAFRLYMSETPSDWCRKEKYKIIGKKK